MRNMLVRIGNRIRYRDFGVMGRAIAARHLRCRDWWAPHLSCSRSFIREKLPREGQTVAVLGAGRLLDIDLEELLDRYQEIHLFDADPGCRRIWKKRYPARYDKTVFGHTVDITECLTDWTDIIRGASSKEDLQNRLQGLQAPSPKWGGSGFDGCISLNILSQIPLYWRDRVMQMYPRWELQSSPQLSASMDALQSMHLHAVARNSIRWSALLTDTEYYFYHVDSSEWSVESALFASTQELYRSEYQNAQGESWWWHLAPQFIEDSQVGEIHRIEAVVNTKNS